MKPAKKQWGSIHGNNMFKRAYLSSVGIPSLEPFYTAKDGMNYSGFDVTFSPDNPREAEAQYQKFKTDAQKSKP